MENSHSSTSPEVQPAELIVPAAPRRATPSQHAPRRYKSSSKDAVPRADPTASRSRPLHQHLSLQRWKSCSSTKIRWWRVEDIGGTEGRVSRASRVRNILESISIQRITLLWCSTVLETTYAIRRSSYKDWTEHEQEWVRETQECSRSNVHCPTSATWGVGMWLHNARQSTGVASLCRMQSISQPWLLKQYSFLWIKVYHSYKYVSFPSVKTNNSD